MAANKEICKGHPNYHLGHVVLEAMRRRPPEDLFQVDANTDSRETVGAVLLRVVRLARALRRLGLRPGAPLALAGRNHNALRLPYYAAMLNGLPIAGVDPLFKYGEIKNLFKTLRPELAFCDLEMYETFSKVAKDLDLDVKIFTFADGECSLSTLIDDIENSIHDFEPAVFDADKVYAWLLSTSGSTGVPKLAACKHSAILQSIEEIIEMGLITNAAEDGIKRPQFGFNSSPVQWLSGFMSALLMPILNWTILQTSNFGDIGHYIGVINTYKPKTMGASPSLVSSILYHEKHCDMTCFDTITLAGEKVHKELIAELQVRLRKDARIQQFYGQTETLGPVTSTRAGDPPGSCGGVMPNVQLKLVDPETGDEITEPHKTGELLVKSPYMFSEYYNNESETALAFTSDGWYRTGDLLYQDRLHHYYFVDRLKMLIKYRSYHVNPLEIEEVIFSHPGVLEAAVTGLPDPMDGQLPVACVVRRPGCDVSAREIKGIVAEKLSTSKQLRGGVVFLNVLPKTSTGKVARHKLKEIALQSHRE